MKASELNNYFDNVLSLEVFFEKLRPEVSEYISKMPKRGSSIPIYFEEDQEVNFANIKLRKLLIEISLENYNLNTLAYICDCLTVGEKIHYTDPISTEIIFDLADNEMCAGLTIETVATI